MSAQSDSSSAVYGLALLETFPKILKTIAN